MISDKLNILTLIARYFRIVTIGYLISISILGVRFSINQANAEELFTEATAAVGTTETLPGLTPITTIPLGENQSRNVVRSPVPVLTNRLIYRLKGNANLLGALSTAQMADLLANSNSRVEKISALLTSELLANSAEIRTTPLARTFVMTLSSSTNIENTIKTLSQLPFIDYVEPDQIVQVESTTPNDTYFGEQWNLNNANDADIDAPEAWDIDTASKWINIAILDTGVERQHSEFYKELIKGSNFTSNDSTLWDDGYGHGTHVAGIAAARTNNNMGIAGVCWGNCRIIPVKVLTDDGWGYYSWIANGVVYAAQNSAKVINLSLGSTTDSQTLHEAIQYAYKKGVTVVAAAGNNGGAVLYPAAYPETIAVAATDSNDGIPWWSNRGSEIDLAAPGVDILSTYLDNSLAWMSGTSMATPHVAGVAAALQSFYRQRYGKFLKPESVRCYLQLSADDLGLALNKQGAGRLNLQKLLQLVADPNFVDCNI
ncbi:MAG: peptidase S8 [Thioploca sp.]|nr:peptidase S8 [Thioploca sp.]